MFCVKCGTKLDDGSNKCGNCGAVFAVKTNSASAPQQTQQPPKVEQPIIEKQEPINESTSEPINETVKEQDQVSETRNDQTTQAIQNTQNAEPLKESNILENSEKPSKPEKQKKQPKPEKPPKQKRNIKEYATDENVSKFFTYAPKLIYGLIAVALFFTLAAFLALRLDISTVTAGGIATVTGALKINKAAVVLGLLFSVISVIISCGLMAAAIIKAKFKNLLSFIFDYCMPSFFALLMFILTIIALV